MPPFPFLPPANELFGRKFGSMSNVGVWNEFLAILRSFARLARGSAQDDENGSVLLR